MSAEGAGKIAAALDARVTTLLQGAGTLSVAQRTTGAQELVTVLRLLPGQAGETKNDAKWDTLWSNAVSTAADLVNGLRGHDVDMDSLQASAELFKRIVNAMVQLITQHYPAGQGIVNAPSIPDGSARDDATPVSYGHQKKQSDVKAPPKISAVEGKSPPTADSELRAKLPNRVADTGEWAGDSAGGCQNFRTFQRNPQWFLSVPTQTELIIILEQEQKTPLRSIGACVVFNGGERFCSDIVLEDAVFARTGSYINLPAVGWHGTLPGGDAPYVIIPSTFAQGEETGFTIRVYSMDPVTLSKTELWAAPAHESHAHRTNHFGQWRGISAGGCTNHATAVNNPTFYITTGAQGGSARLLLTQEISRQIVRPPNDQRDDPLPRSLVHIGMSLGMSLEHIRKGDTVASNGTFVNSKSIALDVEDMCPLTTYCLLPSTFNPGVEGVFSVSVSSDHPVEVNCTSLKIGDEFAHVVEWLNSWPDQSPDFSIGMYDAPQLGIKVTKTCDLHVTLAQTPPPGDDLLEINAFLLDASGFRVLHGGETCLASCGEFNDVREVSFQLKLPAKAEAYTLLPATTEFGVLRKFSIVVRSTEPIETFHMTRLSTKEVNSKLVADLGSREIRKQVHALRGINDRVGLQPSVDKRMSMRADYLKLGIQKAISDGRVQRRDPEADDDEEEIEEFEDLADRYEDDAEMDELDPTNKANKKREAEFAAEPLWPIKISVPSLGIEEEVQLERAKPFSHHLEMLVKKFNVPDGAHCCKFGMRTLRGKVVDIAGSDLLGSHSIIRTQGLTVLLLPREVKVNVDVGGKWEVHTMEAAKSVRGAVENIARALRIVQHQGYGIRMLPLALDDDGASHNIPLDPNDVAEDGWMDLEKPLSTAFLPPNLQRALAFGKMPITIHVEVHFFEKMNVSVVAGTLDKTIVDVKEMVLAAKELRGHVVPKLFADYHLFKPATRGNDKLLRDDASLMEAGVSHNSLLYLKLVKEDDEEEEVSVAPKKRKGNGLWHYDESEDVTYEFNESGKKFVELATLNSLICLITTEPLDVELLDTFLLTYQSFCSVPQLMSKLIERSNVPPQSELPVWHPAKTMMMHEFEMFVKQTKKEVKNVVTNLAKYFSEYLSIEDRRVILETAEILDESLVVYKFVHKALNMEQKEKEAAEQGGGYALHRSGTLRKSTKIPETTVPDKKVYLRVTCGDVTKVLPMQSAFTVRQAINNVAGKFGIMDVMSYHMSNPNDGVMDPERTLDSFDLEERAEIFCRKNGAEGAEGMVAVTTHDLRVIHGSDMKIVKVAGNLFVSEVYFDVAQLFKLDDLAGYELYNVQHGVLDRNRSIDNYGLVSNSEVFLQKKSGGEMIKKPDSMLYTIKKQVVENQGPPPQSRKVPMRSATKLTVWDLNATETARQMTLLDFTAYSGIQPIELLGQAWTKERHAARCKNINAFIHRFNRLSSWVAHTILMQTKAKKRAKLMAWHIKLAGKLAEIGNFHGVMAILGGLSNPACTRLKFTNELLTKKSLQEKEELEALMSMANGYKVYREKLEASTHAIPYLGVFLCDLIFVEDGNPDTIDGMVNFGKRRMCRKAILNIQKFQHSPYVFKAVPKVQFYLEICKLMDDKTLYDMSLTLEPRGAEKSQIKF